ISVGKGPGKTRIVVIDRGRSECRVRPVTSLRIRTRVGDGRCAACGKGEGVAVNGVEERIRVLDGRRAAQRIGHAYDVSGDVVLTHRAQPGFIDPSRRSGQVATSGWIEIGLGADDA